MKFNWAFLIMYLFWFGIVTFGRYIGIPVNDLNLLIGIFIITYLMVKE